MICVRDTRYYIRCLRRDIIFTSFNICLALKCNHYGKCNHDYYTIEQFNSDLFSYSFCTEINGYQYIALDTLTPEDLSTLQSLMG